MGKYVPLDGYPQPFSSKIENRGDFFGSNNYQTGGEQIVPQTFGLSAFESVSFAPLAYSQNYYAKVIYPTNPVNTELRASAFQSNGANANGQVLVQWFVAANNAQVAANTNLAAEGIRMSIVGI